MMSKKQRLHPAAIIFTLIKTFKEMIFTIGVGFFAFKDAGLIYLIMGICLFVVVALLVSTLSWYRYTYRLEEEELRIEYGIFIRKKRYISKNRIQSIDLTQSVVHRMFKLVRVNIETAGSGTGAEASLKAVKLSAGEKLRKELKTNQSSVIEETESQEESDQALVKKITTRRLFLAGTTSGSIGIIFVLFSVLFSEIEQFVPDDYYETTFETIISYSIVLLAIMVLALILLLWVMGIAGTMIKYGNFTIRKNEDELYITRGLLEKKQTTIPIKRIQAVGVNESLLRQPLGYVTVFAEVAGGSISKGEEFSTVLFPIMKRDEVDDFLSQFLPQYGTERNKLTGLPSKAKTFYIVRSAILLVAAIIIMLFFLPQFILAPLILLVFAIILGLLQHKDAGIRIDHELLTIRYRVVNRKTIVLFHKRIQSFENKQHFLQQRASLATIRTSIVSKLGAGKHYTIKDLSTRDVMDLFDWYSYRD
ncbi:PH domain-containing protein [Virgibacillus flavescens]|uniref:PH domain-containing protein n=1 Tax=Virgibacillus flavescens TaxID=1611422 RepID=UPI003D3588CC